MTVPGFNVLPALRSLYIPDGYELDNNYSNSVWFSGLQEIRLPSDLEVIPDLYFGGIQMQSIDLPSSLKVIEGGAFEFSSLTGITIPEGVTRIGNSGSSTVGVFTSCSGLTSVSLPSTLEFIGDGTFYNCSGLTETTIPSGVTYIGGSAFVGCQNLASITFEGLVPPTLEDYSNALGYTNETFPIYVPCGSVSAYKSAYANYADRISCIE
jgi:hypothetical protein